MPLTVSVVRDDVSEVPSDLLLLKYARGFHGADDAVARRLASKKICRLDDLRADENDFALVDTAGAIEPKQVLYLGTGGLGSFRYREMRQFARKAVEIAARKSPDVRTITLTVHGANYGLDMEESFRCLVTGLQQGLVSHPLHRLERIVFVEKNARRAEILKSLTDDVELVRPGAGPAPVAPAPRTKYAFVAMPFSEEFEDVYQFGIYSTVRRCGYICEKVDEAAYAGSIIDRITEGIKNASFVIADLSLERPNVYLEVGFAWGLKKPVILVAREGQRLHFDLAHHKCIFYRTIGKLSEALEDAIVRGFGRGDE